VEIGAKTSQKFAEKRKKHDKNARKTVKKRKIIAKPDTLKCD
jgi:hypothetical protein